MTHGRSALRPGARWHLHPFEAPAPGALVVSRASHSQAASVENGFVWRGKPPRCFVLVSDLCGFLCCLGLLVIEVFQPVFLYMFSMYFKALSGFQGGQTPNLVCLAASRSVRSLLQAESSWLHCLPQQKCPRKNEKQNHHARMMVQNEKHKEKLKQTWCFQLLFWGP